MENFKEFIDANYKLYIDGKWVDSSNGATLKAYCPANGQFLANCADASREDVDKAVKAASRAFESWKDIDPKERALYLLKIADLMDENAKKIAMVETIDNGKPIRETMNVDIPLAADHFRYFAGAVRTEEGRAVMLNDHTLSIILREPIGVVGQIIPWNFPFLMGAWKLAPALAAGDTVVIKPSSTTSLSILELTKLIDKVLPGGVVNVITGRGSTAGNYMLEHEGFSKLAFTGSTEVGYQIADAAAKKLIPATLELGGKSANIFFDDCNLEKAIDGVQMGILFNQGQVCCAGSRVFVQEGIYEKFLEKMSEAFKKVKIGLPWKEETMMGTQVNGGQASKILEYVKIGKNEGARLVTGGGIANKNDLENGAFIEPTILADVNNSMRVAQEEIFGPVVCVIKFKTEEEVIKMANDSDFGLGGGVWTNDLNTALRVSRGVKTGRMWVNTYNELPAHAPFGGYKKSGIGRENHKMMLDHYSQVKNIYINMSEKSSGMY